MPTYSYECEQCGHVMDLFHSMSAQPEVKCEECGSACQRLMGAGSGIIFKGSGFYETDYKNKHKSEARSAGNGADNKEGAKSESSAAGKNNGGKEASGKESSGNNGASNSDKAASKTKSTSDSTS